MRTREMLGAIGFDIELIQEFKKAQESYIALSHIKQAVQCTLLTPLSHFGINARLE